MWATYASLGCSPSRTGLGGRSLAGNLESPDVSLPKTVISSVDNLISAGGVITTSLDNVILYNSEIQMRLLGGLAPHDELLDLRGLISSRSFWWVEGLVGGLWVPMLPSTSRFTVLGTNSTGTSMVREMNVTSSLLSGLMRIVYKASSGGPLNWDIDFSPRTSARYRLVFAWWNITNNYELSTALRRFRVGYGSANYTFAWDDISRNLNSTTSINQGEFRLTVDLGAMMAGSHVLVDPSLVDSVSSSSATAYTFQRKVFYEPKGGYYFVFYYLGLATVYKSSPDGTNWSAYPQSLPPGMNQYTGPREAMTPAIYQNGQTVIAAVGQDITGTSPSPWRAVVYLNYTVGSIIGPTIYWGPVFQGALAVDYCDNDSSSCYMRLGIRYVSVAVSSDGFPVISYNLYEERASTLCGTQNYSESDVFVAFRGTVYFADGRRLCGQYDLSDNDRSVVLPADSNGNIRVIYQYHSGSTISLRAQTFRPGGQALATLPPITPDKDTYGTDGTPFSTHGTDTPIWLQGGNPRSVVLIHFSPPPGIPPAQITSATLTVNEEIASCPSTNDCNSAVVGAPWHWYEGSFNWQSCGFTGCYPYTIPPPNTNHAFANQGLHTLTETNVVQAWYGGALNYGFMFLMNESGFSQEQVSFTSREATSGGPTLTINYCCSGTPETIDSNVYDSDEFSAVSDTNYATHVVYRSNIGYTNINYAYRSASTNAWTVSNSIFSGNSFQPTITVDYSTNDVYAFVVQNFFSIAMRTKSPSQNWSDGSISYPVTGAPAPSSLGSNYFSMSSTISNHILLVWTEGSAGSYDVAFASIPIGAAWSPYSSPSDPWDGNGIIPYGQYFSNLGEEVSTSTGMLTIKQSDLSVPGRGMDLAISRVYVEPYSFLNSSPYSYEKYQWAPMGDGWQLNFPWMNNTSHPLYLHLWDGEGYRLPSSFWLGFTATFENHQGENFRLVRNLNNSIMLYAKTGSVLLLRPFSQTEDNYRRHGQQHDHFQLF